MRVKVKIWIKQETTKRKKLSIDVCAMLVATKAITWIRHSTQASQTTKYELGKSFRGN